MRCFVLAAMLSLAAACSRTNTPSAPVVDTPLAAHVPLRCESRRLDLPAPGSTGPRRTVGGPAVLLHESTLETLHARGIRKVSMRPHFCLDATGALECLDFMDQAEPHSVAQTIVDAVQEWKFEPYVVDGKGKEFCSQLAFNYKIQ
jgi:hypothetical protein